MSENVRLTLAKQIAAESAVLLKNENHLLPVSGGTVAMIGQTLYQPTLGGMGSGMSFMGRQIPAITDASVALGLMPEPGLDQFYHQYFSQHPQENAMEKLMGKLMELQATGVDLVASGAVYDLFDHYEPQKEEVAVPQELLDAAAKVTDTALLGLGRSTGSEECDRYITDDYLLLDSEKKLIRQACAAFSRVILLVNTNGLTDLSWIDDFPSIQAVLFIGAGGEMGPAAVAELLTGKETPSGKLAFTIADSYERYPTANQFSFFTSK